MSRKLRAALAASICLVIFRPSLAAAAPEKKTQARPAVKLTEKEHRLVNAVNEFRDERGLEPLKVDPVLMQEARQSAPHFSHCINGRWCWHRCKARGFQGWATDDLANGYPTPEDAVQGWATSDGHALQMRGYFKMNGRWQNYNFDKIGVGIAGRKYIAIFGRKNIRSCGSIHATSRLCGGSLNPARLSLTAVLLDTRKEMGQYWFETVLTR